MLPILRPVLKPFFEISLSIFCFFGETSHMWMLFDVDTVEKRIDGNFAIDLKL